MIKASLSHLLVYYESIRMPKAVGARLDRIRRNFLWKGMSDRRKLHLMKQNVVLLPNRYGAWALDSRLEKFGAFTGMVVEGLSGGGLYE